MQDSRAFALGPLTVLDLAPPEIVAVAARAGYDYAGLRLLPATPQGIAYPLMDDSKMLRETLARMRDTGMRIFDLEMVRINEHFNCDDFLPFLEIGAALGAQCILVAGDDPDISRFTANFATLCDAAAPFNLKPNIEFMPWTAVPDLRLALDILRAADRPNAGLLVDAIHFDRSDSHLDDLEKIPATWLQYAQICDAPAERPTSMDELIRAAREERLLPGEGGMPLADIFSRLPATLPLCVEIPNARLGTSEERARRGLDAARHWCTEHLNP